MYRSEAEEVEKIYPLYNHHENSYTSAVSSDFKVSDFTEMCRCEMSTVVDILTTRLLFFFLFYDTLLSLYLFIIGTQFGAKTIFFSFDFFFRLPCCVQEYKKSGNHMH